MFRVSFTCRHITYIPNPQAIPLSPEGVNEGMIGTTCSTEQHTLFTDGEICYYSFNNHKRQENIPLYLIYPTFKCRIYATCICSYHFHVP